MLPSEYHFCTYFDRNYLTRGLVLYRSLARHCQHPFTLWVLCFDATTYQTLDRLHLPGMHLIALEQFEAGDSDLQRAKAERSLVEYFWTCTPSLPLYVLNHHPEVHLITYLDADLCFYADPLPIYAEMGDGSVLIVEHRFPPEHAHLAPTSGIYNVGFLAFRRDDRGLACLRWWRDRCLEWCFTRYEDGKFGDQKYLDDWPQRFGRVVVLQHKGAGLAPWNATQYSVGWKEGRLTVSDAPLIFYHFQGFKSVARNVVQPASHRYRLSPLLVEYLYFPYAHALREAERDMGVGESIVRRERNSGWLRLLPRLLEQRWLLVTPRRLALTLWMLGERQHDRLLTGLDAYRRGDLPTGRRLCFSAVLHNPFSLSDRQILSILVRTTLKPGQISFLQRLRGRAQQSGRREGCPVIASRVSGSEYQLGDTASLFDPSNPEERAMQMKTLYEAPALRETLIARGLHTASHSSVTKLHPALPNAKSDELAWPRISIVTPTFNRAEYLEEAVRSVLFQGYPHLEYLVIDGGSTDGTLEILHRYPQVRVISEPDAGLYHALNKGIRLGHGDIIGLLNGDDLFEPGAIVEAVGQFRRDPTLAMVSGGAVVFKQDASGSRREVNRWMEEERIRLSVANVLFGVPMLNARFLRREVFESVGFFDTRFRISADREFLLRVALAQLKEGSIGRTVYAYRAHPGSLTFGRSEENLMQTCREHLTIGELYLRRKDVPRRARATLRHWHSREARLAGWLELSKRRPLSATCYALRGWRYDPIWPFVSAFCVARKAFRQVGRGLFRGGELHTPK